MSELTRREVLEAASVLAMLGALSATLSGCGEEPRTAVGDPQVRR
jgi:hypothetical protein